MPESEEFDARPVRAFLPRADLRVDESRWPASVPAMAYLLELGAWGIRPAAWEDLGLVIGWRQFMRDPRSYFRHLFDEL
jgi:hypothetical protein